jgi:peptide chain release factor subunit 1
MDSERLRPLLTAPGPFASVYFEDSHDTQDADAQLELRWRGLREQLEELGADESVTADMERAVLSMRPPIGRSGRAVIAGADGVVLNEHLIRPTAAPIVRLSKLPYVVPIVEHGFQDLNYLLVAVDHTGADITVHAAGKVRSESVESDDADPQLRNEEAGSKNLRAVADRVEKLLGDSGAEAVFVIGEVRSRADFLATLPHQVRALVVELQVGARHSGHDVGDEVHEAIEEEFLKRRLAVIDDAAQRFTAEVGRQSGLAAEGLGPVCSGLRQGAVDTLIIGDIGEKTVVADEELTTLAPTAEVLSEQGAAAARTLRADEALPMFAVSVGASLVRTDERIAPADGVGAVLRYAPTLH